MKRLILTALTALAVITASVGTAAADTWISPGQSRSIVCWSLPLTTSVQRVNFADLRGPNVSYLVTVTKNGWSSAWPWAWWSWSGSYSPLSAGPGRVSATFTTQPGRDYHLELRGLEGVGFTTCVVTLSQVGGPAFGVTPTAGGSQFETSPSGPDSAATTGRSPVKVSWGRLKSRYR